MEYIDYAKVFDGVSHDIILDKLNEVGIDKSSTLSRGVYKWHIAKGETWGGKYNFFCKGLQHLQKDKEWSSYISIR